MDSAQPSNDQARAVAVHLRGADNFPHGRIDWLAVGHLGAHRAGSDERIRPGTAPTLPLRALTALNIRLAILSGERPLVRDAPVSFETLGAIYFILTEGQYAKECPNSISPQGRHRWRFSDESGPGVRQQTCDYCGDQRASP